LVVPSGTENELEALGASLEAIDRRYGPDRYLTNMYVNLYMLGAAYGGEGKTSFNGSEVALVSGQAPWDALAAAPYAAKNNYHVLMTASAAPTANVVALGGALASLGAPSKIKVLGGTAAVSNAVRDAAVATADSGDITSTMASCNQGGRTALLTFSGAIRSNALQGMEHKLFLDDADADALGQVDAGAGTDSGFDGTLFTLNGIKHSVIDSIETVSTSAVSSANPADADLKTFVITFNNKLAAGDKLAFLGVDETDSSDVKRELGGSSCTVGVDSTGPKVTSVSVVVSTAAGDATKTVFNHAIISFDSALGKNGAASSASVAAIAGNLGYWRNGAAPLFDVTSKQNVTLTATNVPGTYSYIVSTSATNGALDVTLAAGTQINYAKAGMEDINYNVGASDGIAYAAADATGPTMSASATTCKAKDGAKITRGDLEITAKGASSGGTVNGIAGNGYKLTVVNQRGSLMPTVVVDKASSSITITMDTGYHTVDDIVTVAANQFQTGDWTFSKKSGTVGNGSVTETTTAVGPLAANRGTSTCSMTLSFSEPSLWLISSDLQVTAANSSVTETFTGVGALAGITATESNVSYSNGVVVTFDTDYNGDVSVSGVNLQDAEGNVRNGATATSSI